MGEPTSQVVLVADERELRDDRAIWGSGGWDRPEDREALDWLGLLRLLGWGVTIARADPPSFGADALPPSLSHVVVAVDPVDLGDEAVDALASALAMRPLLVVCRAPPRGFPLARLTGSVARPGWTTGRTLSWTGPGSPATWSCRDELTGSALELGGSARIWAALDGGPVVAARKVGRGVVACLGIHPSEARDTAPTCTALLRRLLTNGGPAPCAWLDLEGTMVLRMDDPGGSPNVHHRPHQYPKINGHGWADVCRVLAKRQGRMSVLYVSGWVDDGQPSRGELFVDGRPVRRVPGAVHPSPLVTYRKDRDRSEAMEDYGDEFRGIQLLRQRGLGDVELHGYTHIHPDGAGWAAAPDRYERDEWYRELGRERTAWLKGRPPQEHPLALGIAAIERFFGIRPTTLVPPGDDWSDESLEHALDLGLQLVDSYYLGVRHGRHLAWTTHVCAPYLDTADRMWFEGGVPVVGYFHDFDVARRGVSWMEHCLDEWVEAGASRFIDFRELAAAIGRRLSVEESGASLRLIIEDGEGPLAVRPIPVLVRAGDASLPPRILGVIGGHEHDLEVVRVDETTGRVLLPC